MRASIAASTLHQPALTLPVEMEVQVAPEMRAKPQIAHELKLPRGVPELRLFRPRWWLIRLFKEGDTTRAKWSQLWIDRSRIC